MSFSPAVKWLVLIVVLLPLTLSWKLAIRPGGDASAYSDVAAQQRVAEFLVRQRFIVVPSKNIGEGQPMLQASAGPCRLLVTKSPAIGWDRDLIRRHALPTDEVFVVFRGRLYAEQPTHLTAIDFLWSRLLRELGLSSQSNPVLAVIASQVCRASELPWAEIQ